MKKIVFLLVAILLTGCADFVQKMQQAQAQEKQDKISAESSDNLCVVMLARPEYRQLAESELRRRNYECNWPRAQAMAQVYLQARSQADANLTAIGIGLMNQGTPHTLGGPQINCRSSQAGIYTNTTCQ